MTPPPRRQAGAGWSIADPGGRRMTVWTSTGSARSVDPVRPAGPVVVGVPDAGAEALLPVAVGRAREHDVAIDLVRVWRTVDWLYSASATEAKALVHDQEHDRHLLDTAADQIRDLAPDVALLVDFAPGDLYTELLDRTRGASALVIGDDLVEEASIAEWYLEHAYCPVVVVNHGGHVIAEGAGTRDLARYGPHRS